jgi:glycosyltransferase involved in cell wall biosynthesis
MSPPQPAAEGSARSISVVHLITDLDVGGAEMMLARLLDHADRIHVRNAVICLSGLGPVAEQIARAAVPVYALEMRSGRVDPTAFLRLVKYLRQLKPDVLQTWLYHSDLAGLAAGFLTRVPNVVWNIRCAELDPADHPISLRIIIRCLAWLSRLPSTVISNSIAGKLAHEQLGYHPRKWLVIPNGVDTWLFQPSVAARGQLRRELRLGDDTLLVGVLARVHPMKDHTTFLKAAAATAKARDDVHFVLAGRGVREDPRLAGLVRDLELADRVHLLGECSNPAQLLAALDVAVSSSYSEAFPNVVAEAMACGIPCVVTDAGDSPAIVGSAGVVVPRRDPSALAQGIMQLLNLDPGTRRRLGAAARERILQEYSIQQAALRYEALYTDLANASVQAF